MKKMGDEVKQANERLKLLADSDACWWSYTVSLYNFELLAGDPLNEPNIVLFLGACSHISGPVNWKNRRLKVEWHNNPPSKEREWSFTVVDEYIGFKVEAKGFSFASDYNVLDRKYIILNK
jgi:hypothetical protein